MLKTYKNILITFPILILAWGCYTTSQHPLVHFDDDDGRLNVFKISVYDECKDCHDAEYLEELKAVHKPMMTAINNYNYDYYSGNSDLENYYNEKPWWHEYRLNLIYDDDKNDEPEIIVYRNEDYRNDYNPPPPIYYPPPTTSPPKYRNPDSNNSNDRSNDGNSNQKKTDPNPRQRDGGGRGNSNGRK